MIFQTFKDPDADENACYSLILAFAESNSGSMQEGMK